MSVRAYPLQWPKSWAYREKAQAAHPDHGGSQDAFIELAQAKDIALATRRSA